MSIIYLFLLRIKNTINLSLYQTLSHPCLLQLLSRMTSPPEEEDWCESSQLSLCSPVLHIPFSVHEAVTLHAL